MSIKVTADTGVCVASGQCAMLAPRIFDQRDDDGTVIVLTEHPPAEAHDLVRQAELTCPSGAIRLVEP
jgi:ferredoxin